MINEWYLAGETENGLNIWCKIDTFDDVEYLKVKYTDSNNVRIGEMRSYPVKEIRLLNALIDSYKM